MKIAKYVLTFVLAQCVSLSAIEIKKVDFNDLEIVKGASHFRIMGNSIFATEKINGRIIFYDRNGNSLAEFDLGYVLELDSFINKPDLIKESEWAYEKVDPAAIKKIAKMVIKPDGEKNKKIELFDEEGKQYFHSFSFCSGVTPSKISSKNILQMRVKEGFLDLRHVTVEDHTSGSPVQKACEYDAKGDLAMKDIVAEQQKQ